MSTGTATDPYELIRRIRQYSRPLRPLPARQSAVLKPLAGIKAVLFDVYGTLFVSASGDIACGSQPARERSLRRALRACGIPADGKTARRAATLLVDTIRRVQAGLQAEGTDHPEVEIREIFLEVLQALAAAGHPAPDRARAERLALEYELRVNPTWPMPGLRKVLHLLRERGLSLGIVSNAQFYTPLLFAAHLGQPLESLGFDPRLCLWSYQRRQAKPSTALFLAAAEQLRAAGIEPGRALYVGNDRLNDIWPALQAGFRTALFAGDRRSLRLCPDEPGLQQEELVLTQLAQLSEVLT